MNIRCTACNYVAWVPASSAWPASCRCGAHSWVSPVELPATMVATHGYVPTEADALRAEVAALKADYELCRYNKDALMKRQARLEDELTQLRALRDRLRNLSPVTVRVNIADEIKAREYVAELAAIIARAEELAK